MSGAAELTELLGRVEKAEGQDRYADCWLACALDGFFPHIVQWCTRDEGPTWRIDFCKYGEDGGLISPGHGGAQMVRPYTASLDQALGLCERVLPGWRNIIDSDGMRDGVHLGKPLACVFTNQFNLDEPFFDAAAPTRALALLAAMLKALIAKETT